MYILISCTVKNYRWNIGGIPTAFPVFMYLKSGFVLVKCLSPDVPLWIPGDVNKLKIVHFLPITAYRRNIIFLPNESLTWLINFFNYMKYFG